MKRFNFEAFDELCAEVLGERRAEDAHMAEEAQLLSELQEAVQQNGLDEADAEQVLWDYRHKNTPTERGV